MFFYHLLPTNKMNLNYHSHNSKPIFKIYKTKTMSNHYILFYIRLTNTCTTKYRKKRNSPPTMSTQIQNKKSEIPTK